MDEDNTINELFSAKLDATKSILEKGVVMVHCDPRREGVHVPAHLSEDPALRLNFAYGFQLPGFLVDEEGIMGMLNFNGLRFHCVLPWTAIFAVTAPEFDHEGQFWPEDAPEEVLNGLDEDVEIESPKGPSLSVVPEQEPLAPVPSMESVVTGPIHVAAETKAPEFESVEPAPETPTPRNHPRLVKD